MGIGSLFGEQNIDTLETDSEMLITLLGAIAQAELARRKAAQSPTKAAPTGLTSYASKYVLSERLVCGECGTLYHRCTWKKGDRIPIVWRCVCRLDYGKWYCHNSPILDEEPLQRAILAVVNKAMGQKEDPIRRVARTMEKELSPVPGESMSFGDIKKRLEEIDQEVGQLLLRTVSNGAKAYQDRLKDLLDETIALKEKRTFIQKQREKDSTAVRQMEAVVDAMEEVPAKLTPWEESTIRQLVDTVRALSKNQILVCLQCGMQIVQKNRRAKGGS